MQSERTTATIVGVLFIVATGTYMVGQSVYAPIVGAPNYLEAIYPRRGAVLAGLFIETLGIVSIPLIALVFYPVLRCYDQRGALAYIGVRTLETVPLLLVTMHAWSMIAISQDYLQMSGSDIEQVALVGGVLQHINHATFLMSVAIIFPLGALILNSILWRSRLVPRLISGWGLAAAVLLVGGSLLHIFEFITADALLLEIVLSGPIAIQEMVLAVWLIAKGTAGGAHGNEALAVA